MPGSTFPAMALLAAAACFGLARANQMDTVLPDHVPACQCTAWSEAPAPYNTAWVNTTLRDASGASCAIPANASRTLNYYPWCLCNGKPTPCTSKDSVPEQVYIQLAGTDIVVASFVTFEPELPQAPPQGMITGPSGTSTETGVAHWYTTSHASGTPRNYVLNFVRFANLTSRATYTYKVKSGSVNGTWSRTYNFRAPYSAADGGETRIALYGDMGNTLYNNQGNLGEDCAAGRIDAILHMGDHAYNMGDDGDARGDSYMNAFSTAAIASCPFIPVIGNHESTQCPGDEVDESTHERYLNQTWGAAYGQELVSTATSALGHLLSRGSLLGAGVHGARHGGMPSGTSQWYSVDLGLIHLVGLDLDPQLNKTAMLAWLEQDLAAAVANRDAVPWIIVTSHFPLYNADFEKPDAANASAAYYLGDAAETFTTNGHNFVPCSGVDCLTVGEILQTSASIMDPILAKYGVDVYDAGHVHSYDTTWPMCNGTICGGVKSYVDPKGPVHITEGNGGVPGVVGTNSIKPCKTSYGRMCGTGGAYGRFITSNASVLSYEHVENPTGKVTDTWSIVKTK